MISRENNFDLIRLIAAFQVAIIHTAEHLQLDDAYLQSVSNKIFSYKKTPTKKDEVIELTGLNEIFNINENYLILLSKLEGLKLYDTDFMLYRKTIFEAITLLRGII